MFYYLGDHLGTSRVIVQGGQSTACYEADNEPFGKERIVTDTETAPTRQCRHPMSNTGVGS